MNFLLCLVTISLLLMAEISEATLLKIILRYDDYSRSSDIHVEKVLFDSAEKMGSGILVGVIPFPELSYSSLDQQGLQKVRLSEQKIFLLKRYASQGVMVLSQELVKAKYAFAENQGNGAIAK